MKRTAICLFYVIFFFSCTIKEKPGIETARIRLGKQLFYEFDLSYNQTKSCSSCHDPKFAFTDSYQRSIGIYGDEHQRNSRPLFNLNNQRYLTAADSTIHTLEQQMNNPMFNSHPPELGIGGHEKEIINRLKKKPEYQELFAKSFPGGEINFSNIKTAIAGFLRTIESYNSNYDLYLRGDTAKLNADEKKGMQLFFSNRLGCSNCHGGSNFDLPTIVNETGNIDFYFNTGLYDMDGRGSYPLYDQGLFQKTKNRADMGKFRVPTLRNLVFTAPYYHDGSEQKLLQVLENYNRGGRIIITGENQGDGSANPFKNKFIRKLDLNKTEKKQLLTFLFTLTDSALLIQQKYLPSEKVNK
jgi:cytochrome c peroxidase